MKRKTRPLPISPSRRTAGQIKTGSLSRTDRVAKYNQLLRIEQCSGRTPFTAAENVSALLSTLRRLFCRRIDFRAGVLWPRPLFRSSVTFHAHMPEPQQKSGTGTSTPPTVSRGKIFLRRLASSVALWTIVLLAIFSKNKLVSDYFFLLIMVSACGRGA